MLWVHLALPLPTEQWPLFHLATHDVWLKLLLLRHPMDPLSKRFRPHLLDDMFRPRLRPLGQW